jgi:hypothetical protein
MPKHSTVNYTSVMHTPSASGAPKPDHLFDRDAEWKGLVSFAADAHPGATLAVVSGRRRQGKSYLLRLWRLRWTGSISRLWS